MTRMTPGEAAEILSRPVTINRLTLKNRIVMGPMAATGAHKGGRPSEQTMAFFEARARGGAGMIIVSSAGATRAMAETRFQGGIRADTDEFAAELRQIADTVHAYGVPIIAEISPSMGRMATPTPECPLISASPVNVVMRGSAMGMPLPGGKVETAIPREATIAEIEGLEEEMIQTAVRLERLGWDGVEVAAIMSYFLVSFLSPRTNHRTDRYGGSVENRARILVNIVRGIRERVRPDFIVGLRITANDYMPDGQKGFAEIAKEVEKAGIDYVALSFGCYEALDRTPDAEGANLIDTGDALVFKRVLSVPVMVQGLHDPVNAAQALADGHGDIVLEARQMLADPDYARKVTEGRFADIVRCDRGGYCMRRMALNIPVRCTVNPRMGREARKAGQLPPLDRILKRPIEPVMLRLTQSKLFMNMIGLAMKKPTNGDAV